MNKYIKAMLISILSILGGIAYRFGGSANGQRWVRPFGEGLCSTAIMAIEGLLHWSLVLCFGICWGMTTYFKKNGTDAVWWNWMLVGLVFGLVPLPYCIFTNSHWIGFGIRTIVCMALTPIWNIYVSSFACRVFRINKDVSDEFGRGFINVATLPLLLLGA